MGAGIMTDHAESEFWRNRLIKEQERSWVLLSENERLRRELRRAVRDIERLGTHTATIEGCPICNTVRGYGFDPEALREDVGQ
jgi:uncharacterized protein (UPF0335 family)